MHVDFHNNALSLHDTVLFPFTYNGNTTYFTYIITALNADDTIAISPVDTTAVAELNRATASKAIFVKHALKPPSASIVAWDSLASSTKTPSPNGITHRSLRELRDSLDLVEVPAPWVDRASSDFIDSLLYQKASVAQRGSGKGKLLLDALKEIDAAVKSPYLWEPMKVESTPGVSTPVTQGKNGAGGVMTPYSPDYNALALSMLQADTWLVCPTNANHFYVLEGVSVIERDRCSLSAYTSTLLSDLMYEPRYLGFTHAPQVFTPTVHQRKNWLKQLKEQAKKKGLWISMPRKDLTATINRKEKTVLSKRVGAYEDMTYLQIFKFIDNYTPCVSSEVTRGVAEKSDWDVPGYVDPKLQELKDKLSAGYIATNQRMSYKLQYGKLFFAIASYGEWLPSACKSIEALFGEEAYKDGFKFAPNHDTIGFVKQFESGKIGYRSTGARCPFWQLRDGVIYFTDCYRNKFDKEVVSSYKTIAQLVDYEFKLDTPTFVDFKDEVPGYNPDYINFLAALNDKGVMEVGFTSSGYIWTNDASGLHTFSVAGDVSPRFLTTPYKLYALLQNNGWISVVDANREKAEASSEETPEAKFARLLKAGFHATSEDNSVTLHYVKGTVTTLKNRNGNKLIGTPREFFQWFGNSWTYSKPGLGTGACNWEQAKQLMDIGASFHRAGGLNLVKGDTTAFYNVVTSAERPSTLRVAADDPFLSKVSWFLVGKLTGDQAVLALELGLKLERYASGWTGWILQKGCAPGTQVFTNWYSHASKGTRTTHYKEEDIKCLDEWVIA